MGSKRSSLWVVNGKFDSLLFACFFLLFQGALVVFVIMIGDRQKLNSTCKSELHVIERHSKRKFAQRLDLFLLS